MRNALLFVLMIGSAATATAQFEMRPHVGINLQNLTKSEAGTEWKGTPGFQFGANFMLGGQFIIQPGIQYVVSKSELSTALSSATLTTSALRIPVVVGFRFIEPSSEPFLNLRVFGGALVNIPVSATFNEEGLEDVELGGGNYGLNAGVGLDISIFFVEAGYDIGLSNVFDDENITVNTKQNQFQFNAGVRLKFAK